jgi:hypothetical protein
VVSIGECIEITGSFQRRGAFDIRMVVGVLTNATKRSDDETDETFSFNFFWEFIYFIL